ncbi:acyloxyacyl hydrolase isoform X2 [Eurytemora carolleeae]|uniref:acyloxyacyl hydrolase isoform X2 n=1 Tax=Eurytemora carolleeae TaxID=1294199 RepID=UPI000C785F8A|nr:acyloxyacyl hydrolase isoform X2 [Eurytemora carolleeae]|eukprot:XP_023330125.1 acyloxyacyl hydrolase-like isoform X2 [Eurytemora affinis]
MHFLSTLPILGSVLLCSTLGIYVIEGEDEESSTVQQNKHDTKQRLGRGTHGGFPCGACTVLVTSSAACAEKQCSRLPDPLSVDCSNVVFTLGPAVLDYLSNSSTPDTLCYSIGLCNKEPGQCNLFPKGKQASQAKSKIRKLSEIENSYLSEMIVKVFPWLCYIPGVRQLCEALERTFEQLEPGLDIDGDGFSPAETFRGSLWRGRDCHDGNSNIHPGRRPSNGDRHIDSNCNGIYGVNPISGRSWEEELCSGSGEKGIIYIGDSVGAHFHIPAQWFSPVDIGGQIFTNLTEVITNEGDWPHLGFATGFRNSSMPDLIHGKVDSIYLRLRERNLCNHRDYQNLARNGANSTDTLFYIQALNQSRRDLPAIVFYALIGNDVCTEKPDPDIMTTPQMFQENTLKVLQILEKQLAPGSHLVLVGLIDAAFLYDAMAERFHPLGAYNKNIKYKDMYAWFNCMQIGPCAGWMNWNSTLRSITSKRSRELSDVLRQIAEKQKFFNFDITFIDNPFQTVINSWISGGGEVYQLVEPVDSLHPTQAAQTLIAEQVWSELLEKAPHIIGPVNPANQLIQKLFGDQGGH